MIEDHRKSSDQQFGFLQIIRQSMKTTEMRTIISWWRNFHCRWFGRLNNSSSSWKQGTIIVVIVVSLDVSVSEVVNAQQADTRSQYKDEPRKSGSRSPNVENHKLSNRKQADV